MDKSAVEQGVVECLDVPDALVFEDVAFSTPPNPGPSTPGPSIRSNIRL